MLDQQFGDVEAPIHCCIEKRGLASGSICQVDLCLMLEQQRNNICVAALYCHINSCSQNHSMALCLPALHTCAAISNAESL